MNFGTNRNKPLAEGGMSSMTDLVFLLLIFFIIMSIMTNNTVHVDLPKNSEIPTEQDPTTATLVVTEENKYVVFPGGSMESPMEFDDIRDLTAAAVEKSGEMKLKIEGHKQASYEAIFNALALTKANGWTPVLAYDD